MIVGNHLAAAASPLFLPAVDLLVLLLCGPSPVNGHSGREARWEQPAPPVASDAEAPSGIHALKVSSVHTGFVAWGIRSGGGLEKSLLHFAVLLDELPGNDAKDLLDTLAALGTDLVTGVPANLLAPETGAPLRTGAPGFDAAH